MKSLNDFLFFCGNYRILNVMRWDKSEIKGGQTHWFAVNKRAYRAMKTMKQSEHYFKHTFPSDRYNKAKINKITTKILKKTVFAETKYIKSQKWFHFDFFPPLLSFICCWRFCSYLSAAKINKTVFLFFCFALFFIGCQPPSGKCK